MKFSQYSWRFFFKIQFHHHHKIIIFTFLVVEYSSWASCRKGFLLILLLMLELVSLSWMLDVALLWGLFEASRSWGPIKLNLLEIIKIVHFQRLVFSNGLLSNDWKIKKYGLHYNLTSKQKLIGLKILKYISNN